MQYERTIEPERLASSYSYRRYGDELVYIFRKGRQVHTFRWLKNEEHLFREALEIACKSPDSNISSFDKGAILGRIVDDPFPGLRLVDSSSEVS